MNEELNEEEMTEACRCHVAIKQPTGGLLPGKRWALQTIYPALGPPPRQEVLQLGGQMASAPRPEQRRRWKNEAGGGLSAPVPHRQRAGVQRGGRMARRARRRAPQTREEREKSYSSGRTDRKKVSIPERKRKERAHC